MLRLEANMLKMLMQGVKYDMCYLYISIWGHIRAKSKASRLNIYLSPVFLRQGQCGALRGFWLLCGAYLYNIGDCMIHCYLWLFCMCRYRRVADMVVRYCTIEYWRIVPSWWAALIIWTVFWAVFIWTVFGRYWLGNHCQSDTVYRIAARCGGNACLGAQRGSGRAH